jgi:hypothetical protein
MYSRNESWVFIAIANKRGETSVGSKPNWLTPSALAIAPFESISQSSVRLPLAAAEVAKATAILVLPTPPLPVTKSS